MSTLPLICMALLVHLGTVLTTGCTNGEVRLQSTSSSPQKGLVLTCTSNQWRPVCNNSNWNTRVANMVCRQLGFNDQGAISYYSCTTAASTSLNIELIQCFGTERELKECTKDERASCPQGYGCSESKKRQAFLTCLPAACQQGEIRLVNGSMYREGRVEVCMDGRWGTVCSGDQEHVAEAVCTELGFPSEGSTSVVGRFGEGTGAVYSCSMRNEDMTLNCSSTNANNCGHSMDFGVVCQSYQSIYQQQCNMSTVPPPVTSGNCQEQNCGNSSTNGALGAIIGILLALLGILLIAVTVGWIVMKRKKKNSMKRDRHGDNQDIPLSNTESFSLQVNPVYGGTTVQPHPPASYSSLGHAYELVEANEGAGHTYDVVNRNQQRGRSVNQGGQNVQQQNTSTGPTAVNPTTDYNILDHTGGQQGHHVQNQSNKKQENAYHVLEQSSETTPTNGEDHYYRVLENNSSAVSGRAKPQNTFISTRGRGNRNSQHPPRGEEGAHVNIDPNPQDYEIPTPTMKPRGADEDDEEYSRLKH